jgi:hypothetical protein
MTEMVDSKERKHSTVKAAMRRVWLWIVLGGLVAGCVSFHSPYEWERNPICSAGSPEGKAGYRRCYEGYLSIKRPEDLLWNYETGTMAMYAGLFDESTARFDAAEELIRRYDEEVTGARVLAAVGSVLTSDTALDYRPRIYEKILVNTFKAVDFMAAGNLSYARVEVNRALVRQERARYFFKEEIEKEKRQIAAAGNDTIAVEGNVSYGRTVGEENVDRVMRSIERDYSHIFDFRPYADFVNPFATYLSALFLYNDGDYRRAFDLFRETYGMISGIEPGEEWAKRDLALAYRASRSVEPPAERYVWVLFFNGLGPVKKEFSIQVPVFLLGGDVLYTGIALPILEFRESACDALIVSNGTESVRTERVASMDRIVQNEFKKRFRSVLVRAIARAALQTAAQKKLGKELGEWGSIAGALYQMTMNRADLRIWRSLPKEFQVARVRAGGTLTLIHENRVLYRTKTDPGKNRLLFVRIAAEGDEPVVFEATFRE